MSSIYYDFSTYILSGIPIPDPTAPIEINGYRIIRPSRFKNMAHERAFEISKVLASKIPHIYTQRMGDTIIEDPQPVIMTTSECIDVIMFDVPPDIELDYKAKDPDKAAREAMKFVPSFFDEGIVKLDFRIKPKRMWYIQINSKNQM